MNETHKCQQCGHVHELPSDCSENFVPVWSEPCGMCHGTGKLTLSYTDLVAGYMRKKQTCWLCRGYGLIDYVKCVNCDDVIPRGYESEHTCGE